MNDQVKNLKRVKTITYANRFNRLSKYVPGKSTSPHKNKTSKVKQFENEVILYIEGSIAVNSKKRGLTCKKNSFLILADNNPMLFL